MGIQPFSSPLSTVSALASVKAAKSTHQRELHISLACVCVSCTRQQVVISRKRKMSSNPVSLSTVNTQMCTRERWKKLCVHIRTSMCLFPTAPSLNNHSCQLEICNPRWQTSRWNLVSCTSFSRELRCLVAIYFVSARWLEHAGVCVCVCVCVCDLWC